MPFSVSQYAVCVSEIRIILIEESNSCEGSRKATLFESTSRNFVMEGFCIFTIFVRCPNMIPFFASSRRARVLSSCFTFLRVQFFFFAIKSTICYNLT